LAALGSESLVLTAGGEYDLATRAAVRELALSPDARTHARKGLSMVAVARAVADLGLYPVGALREAVVQTQKPDVADANLAAIDAAVAATDDAR
jgi:Pyruvate/2-oxoacid:ferredoxin oxidoreductase gamma subunit